MLIPHCSPPLLATQALDKGGSDALDELCGLPLKQLRQAKAEDQFVASLDGRLNGLVDLEGKRGYTLRECGCIIIAPQLKQFTSVLKSLDLQGTQIGPDGVKHIARLLKAKDTVLTGLNLSSNQLTGDAFPFVRTDGVHALVDAISFNRVLRHLDLSHNELRSEGARSLAQLVEVNTTLRHLDLAGNAMAAWDCDGMIELVNALCSNEELTTLNLADNKMGERIQIGSGHDAEWKTPVLDAIVHVLGHNATLTSLNLSDNYLGISGAELITKAIDHNVGLQVLDVSKNWMIKEQEQPLYETCVPKGIRVEF
jgi:Ran GTPase-activating protein (RanGAP) involved in mRNA processing and transport